MIDATDIKILDESTDGFYNILITDGLYEGIEFNFGKIQFDDSNDEECIMSFEYNLIHNPYENLDETTFKQSLGDLLVEILKKQLAQSEVVYANGTD